MKTRRDFLAALGLGAGASVLGLPGIARACGRRRRREHGCCNVCGGFSGACDCSSLQPGTMVPKATTCTCCCPLYLYATGNNIWYYYCQCCPAGNVFAPSSYQYGVFPNCYDTSKSKCIGAACGSHSQGAQPPIIHKHSPLYQDFFLDPDAMDPDKKNYHADAFKKGIKPPKPPDLKVVPGAEASANFSANVYYDNRYVILYDISHKRTTKVLHIGFQVSDKVDNPATPHQHNSPDPTSFPGYHQVQLKKDGPTYHAVVDGK